MTLRLFLLMVVSWDLGEARLRNNTSSPHLRSTCGIQKTVIGRSPRIIGGINAMYGEWPWQVALLQIDPRDGSFLDHHCGGVLVHRKWILTSAHCLIDPFLKFALPPSFWRVEVGKLHLRNTQRKILKLAPESQDLNSRKNQNHDFKNNYHNGWTKFKNEIEYEYFDNFKVERIIIHKKFHQKRWSNDLALVKFSASKEESKDFIPVCLPRSNSSYVGYSCTISGWGRTSLNGPFSKKLKTISVTILSDDKCKEVYKNIGLFSDHMFCAGNLKGLSGPCVGDSGSPLQCFDQDTQEWVLNGITSWGYGCAKENYPAVYMKVKNYLDWINNIIFDS